MDGLSLLGLVCEKEKQLLKQEEVHHHSTEHPYSRAINLSEDITDGQIDCDLDIDHSRVAEYEVVNSIAYTSLLRCQSFELSTLTQLIHFHCNSAKMKYRD